MMNFRAQKVYVWQTLTWDQRPAAAVCSLKDVPEISKYFQSHQCQVYCLAMTQAKVESPISRNSTWGINTIQSLMVLIFREFTEIQTWSLCFK